MKRNKKQFKFGFKIDPDFSELHGKEIKDVAFCNTGEQHFTILFTDDTYISVGLEYNDDTREWTLCDNYIDDPSCVNDGRLDYWVDSEGGLHFSKWVQELVRLGIWDVTESEVKSLVDKYKEKKEKQEYETYLKLKAKYEKLDQIPSSPVISVGVRG